VCHDVAPDPSVAGDDELRRGGLRSAATRVPAVHRHPMKRVVADVRGHVDLLSASLFDGATFTMP
jgi:hypothetical protein